MDSFLDGLAACADPLRWRIIKLLQAFPNTCVCDLQAILAVPQSTLSSHLSVLRRATLVSSEKRGTWAYYSLCKQISPWICQLEQGPLKAEPALLTQLIEDQQRATEHSACCRDGQTSPALEQSAAISH